MTLKNIPRQAKAVLMNPCVQGISWDEKHVGDFREKERGAFAWRRKGEKKQRKGNKRQRRKGDPEKAYQFPCQREGGEKQT